MAFKIEHFSTAGANSRRGDAPQAYTYQTSDDGIHQMLEDDYFKEVVYQLVANDTITIVDSFAEIAVFTVLSSGPAPFGTVVISPDIITSSKTLGDASFENIYSLDDFEEDGNGDYLLKNGVNYRVFIDASVSTDKKFVCESDYSGGGSLRYMGGQGVLQWETTADQFLSMSASVGATGSFTLENFSVKGDTVANPGSVALDFTPVSLGSLYVINCDFQDFGRFGDVFNVDKVIATNMSFYTLTEDPIVPSYPAFRVDNINDGTFANCNFRYPNLNDELSILHINPDEIEKIYFTDCELVYPTTGYGAIQYVPIDPYSNSLNRDYVFTGCRLLDEDGNVGKNSYNTRSIPIKSITQIGSSTRITLRRAITIVANDELSIWGTADYDDVTVTALTIESTTTFICDAQYTNDNYGGGVTFAQNGTNANRSLDPIGYNVMNAYNCIGIDSPRQKGCVTITDGSFGQGFTGTSFAIILNTPGKILVPESGFMKDFKATNYNHLKLQYLGRSRAQVRCSIGLGILPDTSAKTYKIRMATDSGTVSEEWEISRADSDENDVVLFYSFDTIIQVDGGEHIYPEIAAEVSGGNIKIENLYFICEV